MRIPRATEQKGCAVPPKKKPHKNRNWRFFSFWLLEMFLERNQSICIRYLSSADTVFLFKYSLTQSDDPDN